MSEYLKVVTWLYERAEAKPSPYVCISSNGRSRYYLERFRTYSDTIYDLYFNDECIVEISKTWGVLRFNPKNKGQERAVNTMSMLVLNKEIC